MLAAASGDPSRSARLGAQGDPALVRRRDVATCMVTTCAAGTEKGPASRSEAPACAGAFGTHSSALRPTRRARPLTLYDQALTLTLSLAVCGWLAKSSIKSTSLKLENRDYV